MIGARLLAGGLALGLVLQSTAAPAQETAADPLAAANAAFEAGDWASAELNARAVLGQSEENVRAEAWRIAGLSLFYLGRLPDAEVALLEYLKLDTGAELDPALYEERVVVFFAGVRSRNRATLDLHRPKVEKRSFILNLAPPFGQLQNQQRTKALIVGSLGFTLLAANVTTFVILNRWCNSQTDECPGRESDARSLKVVNIGIGLAAIGVYAYGVVDAVRHHRKWKREQASLIRTLSGFMAPSGDGVVVGVSARF